VQSCAANPCPTWEPSTAWSACSALCNQGIQVRNLSCIAYDGTRLPDTSCLGAQAPPTSQPCITQPCPHWHRYLWGQCSKPCADNQGPGTQQRDVKCLYPHDDPVYYGSPFPDPSVCPPPGVGDTGDGDGEPGVANGKPPSSQNCNIEACASYYWTLSAPSACSASCGGGTATATLTCVDAKDSKPVSANLCVAKPPSNTFICNTGSVQRLDTKSADVKICDVCCVGAHVCSVFLCPCVLSYPFPVQSLPSVPMGDG